MKKSKKKHLVVSAAALTVLVALLTVFYGKPAQTPEVQTSAPEQDSAVETLLKKLGEAMETPMKSWMESDDKASALAHVGKLKKLPSVVMACVYDFEGGEFAFYVKDAYAAESSCPPRLPPNDYVSKYSHVITSFRGKEAAAGYVYLEATEGLLKDMKTGKTGD